MSTQSHSQRGQALVLIVLAIVGMIGLVGLAVDSGTAFSDRRHAQTASDNAALAAALAYVNSGDVTTAAQSISSLTGYNNSGNTSVDVQNPPGPDCTGATPNPLNPADPRDNINYYVQVVIRSRVDTFFGPIVGIDAVNNCVSAIARAKPELIVPPFWGNAVVGLDPTGNSYDSGNSNAAHWTISGGGIFANGNAASKNSGSVTFPDGDCVTAVGTTSGFGCTTSQHNPDLFYNYPVDIIPLLPPIPACDGVAYLGGDGLIHPETGTDGSVWDNGFEGDYAPGLFCITDADGNIHGGITGTDVTFYIADTDFTMKFNGGGHLAASAPHTGTYKGVLIFSGITSNPCTQNIEIRGNGSTPIEGTIFMPSACIDYRGNGTGNAIDSMMVGYQVTSNGNAEVAISYNPDDNYKYPEPPMIELTR